MANKVGGILDEYLQDMVVNFCLMNITNVLLVLGTYIQMDMNSSIPSSMLLAQISDHFLNSVVFSIKH